MTEIGPHLLGRIASPPDERDWKLGDFLASDDQVVAHAVTLLKGTIRGYHDRRYPNPPTRGSNWGKALALLAQIAPAPAPTPPPSGVVEWQDGEDVLDQGNYGTCVGNGWAQWGNTNPVDDRFTEKDARAIYYEATVIDGQPDDPDAPGGGQQGSTVRSGAKAMQHRKRLGSYAFASSVNEIIAFVKAHGPVVCGTDWTSAMFNPQASGFVYPNGSVEGGHCYLLIGYDPDKRAFEFLNSWGASWGKNGRFYMAVDDFAKLLAAQGEACAAVELP
jgi:hypothetical protein